MKKLLAKILIALALLGFSIPASASFFETLLGSGSDTVAPLPIRTFLGLLDTPNSYSGQAGKVVMVNATSSALIFTATSSLGLTPLWGSITGTLSNQTDLQAALDAKLSTTSAYTTYLRLDTTNGPLTGDLGITKLTPELRLTDASSSEYTRLTKATTTNYAYRYNRVNTPSADPYALDFNIDGDNVNIGNYDLTNGSGVFSIMAWIKPDFNNDNNSIVAKWDSTNPGQRRYLLYARSTGVITGAIVQTDGTEKSAASGAYSAGVWQHVALVANGSTITVYLNGVAGTPTAYDGTLNPSTNVISIGKLRPGDNIYQFLGSIDDVAIFNRALSAGDITTAYNGGTGLYSSTGVSPWNSGLTGLWRLDDASGATAVDSSTGGHNGSINGSPTWVAGKVPAGTTASETVLWSSRDGVTSGENGINTFSTSSARTVIDGKTLRLNVGGTEYGQMDANGLLTLTRGGFIDGSSDINQLKVQGNTTQTNDVFVVEKSDGTDFLSVNNTGTTTIANGLKVPRIYPASDATNALQFLKADGATSILNIDTTNSRVGILSSAPSAVLQVGATAFSGTNRVFVSAQHSDTATSGSEAVLGFQYLGSPTATSTTAMRGIYANVGTGPSITASMSGTEFISFLSNFQGRSAVTVGNVYGFKADTAFSSNILGTLTSNTSFYATAPSMASGTITTQYGLRVEDQKVSGVTTAFGLYISGASSRNFIQGRLGVGTSNPQAKLEILGIADEVQLRAIGNGTQTNNIVEIRNSGGTDLVKIGPTGSTTIQTLTGLLKGTSGLIGVAVADTDYLSTTTAGTTYFKLNQGTAQTVTEGATMPTFLAGDVDADVGLNFNNSGWDNWRIYNGGGDNVNHFRELTFVDTTNSDSVPLALTREGTVKIRAGQTGGFARLGGTLVDHVADAGNTGTGEDDLYTDTLNASILGTNSDKVVATYQGVFNGAALATQQLKIYFGGTLIYDSGALSIGVATNNWTANVMCVRESSSVVRCGVSIATDFGTLFPYSKYTRITGLTLSNTQVLKLTGEAAGAGAADNQIVAKLGTVEWKSAN